MAKTIYATRLLAVRDLTPTIRELQVQMPAGQPLAFQAGQFVILHVPHEGKKVPRAYSLASDERQSDRFTLLFKKLPGGIASEYVWRLKGGETLEFSGPFGKCLFHEPPTEQVLFVGTGAGLSQHMSYLLSKGDTYPNVKYRLLLGVLGEHEIYYQPELTDLTNKLPDFKFEYVLDTAPAHWNGKTGFVTNHLDEFDYLQTPTTFYLCGRPAMIQDIKARLASQGFNMNNVIEEAFR